MPLPSGLKIDYARTFFVINYPRTRFQDYSRKYGLPTIPQRPEGFETLVLLILEQVSIDSAKATFFTCKRSAQTLFPETVVQLMMSN